MYGIDGNEEHLTIETEDQPMLEYNRNTIVSNNNNNIIDNNNLKLFSTYIPEYSEQSSDREITLFWQNLSYSIKETTYKTFNGIPYKRETKTRNLIQNLRGSFVSGKLTAILGPNGAGKSTLIECLSGRRKSGFSGDIFVSYKGYKPDLKFSYYSQKDILIDSLTVEECLRYASQLKYCRKTNDLLSPNETIKENSFVSKPKSQTNKYFQRIKVEKLLKDLNLQKCSKTTVCYCSGGQKRRLSIALELIFSPSILLLDEPTSGLDSLSTLQCIQLLKQLSQSKDNPMIIALVIHQPTARLLSYFDSLYIVSSTGQCIYDGATTAMIDVLSKLNLQCPQFHNPSDFAIEIASGDYGLDVIELLAEQQNKSYEDIAIDREKSIKMSKVINKTQKHSIVEQILTTWVLTKRCFQINTRDPKQYFLQFSCVILMLFLIFILHLDYKIGTNDGCLRRPSLEYFKSLHIFDVLNPTNSPFPNWAYIFYSLIFTVFISMLPTVLSFPLEVSIFMKEHSNGWYSLSSYFMAKNIADMPPNIIFPTIYCVVSYIITDQILDFWRLFGYIFIIIILSFLTQGLGFFVSAFFINSIVASTVVGAIVNIPLLLFAGLLIKINTIPQFFQPLTYISYFRLTFESIMTVFYGFGRCPPIEPLTVTNLKEDFGDHIIPMFKCIDDYDSDIVDNVTLAIDYFNEMIDKTYSFSLHAFDYNENNLLMNILILISYAIIIRVFAYIVLVWRTKVK